jgi:MraZ protein
MFRGHYEHAIDGKGRTSLPARFRHALPEADARLVITPAVGDPCLDVYSMPAWEEIERKVAALPKLDRDIVVFRRLYVSAAVECEIDRNGRVLIPPRLRERAQLQKEVLWAGVGTKMELWALDRWEASQVLSDQALEAWRVAIAEKLDL